MRSPALSTGYPRFRRHLRVEVGRDAVHLFDERGVSVVQGAAVAVLAPLLDGRSTLDELAAAQPGGLSADTVRRVVTGLADAGVVVLASARPARDGGEPSAAWWDACGCRDEPATPGPVSVRAVGPRPLAAPVGAALAASEIPLADDPAAAELDVVLCTDYLDPALAEVDAANRAAGRPWLPARIDGQQIWIGPLLNGPDGGCWHCLAHRLWDHRAAEAVLHAAAGDPEPAPRPAACLPAGAAAAAHLVALEVTKWQHGLRHAGQRAVWVLDSRDLSAQHHPFTPRPQCPACGDPDLVGRGVTGPLELAPAPRLAGGDGDRTATPDQVLARFAHLVSPVTGIVKSLVTDPFAPPFAHAVRSGGNLSRGLRGLAALRRSARAENGGKGLSAAEARVGALCEAAERRSGMRHGDEPTVRGSLRGLGDAALDPRGCLLFDERQYRDREAWNATHGPFNLVPRAFDPDRERDWTPLWSLTHGTHRLLPTAMLYFGGEPDPELVADSNGCAAGNSTAEAVLHGLFELIERDAVALWWHNRTRAPGVDLGALPDGRLAEQVACHAGIGRELWVLDITSDLGVPVMVAVSRRVTDPDGTGERILLGFGAHLDPTVAARRAVAEVNQMLPLDGVAPEPTQDPDWLVWCRCTAADAPHVLPAGTAAPAAALRARGADLRDEVSGLVATLAAHDLEVLVLDQTRPDIGLPVVRVVVPGLRTYWARYAPGRLFDVPVRLGLRPDPLPYTQLNPIPLFL